MQKKAWYYRPADWKSSSRGKMSLDEIRETYGSERVKDEAKQHAKSRLIKKRQGWRKLKKEKRKK